MKIAIIYTSYSGNTKDLAESIRKRIEVCGHEVRTFSIRDKPKLSGYDYYLFGSLTWSGGSLPIQMRKFLKEILIANPLEFKNCSVFGTGETQWGEENYCKAVDEMEYHLQKNNKNVQLKLKIEQNPIGKEKYIQQFVNNLMKEVEFIGY